MVSKKTRFEVFKRDGFKCQYCGQTPPAVVLEVDHVKPKSAGGEDDVNNYVTSCFDCNRGKGARTLDQVPATLTANIETLREREAQVLAYNRLLKTVKAREAKIADAVNAVFRTHYPGYTLGDKFMALSLPRFVKALPEQELLDAMEYACNKMPRNRDRAVKYFCGICWNKIRNNQNGEV